jgi:hypothetical protein
MSLKGTGRQLGRSSPGILVTSLNSILHHPNPHSSFVHRSHDHGNFLPPEKPFLLPILIATPDQVIKFRVKRYPCQNTRAKKPTMPPLSSPSFPFFFRLPFIRNHGCSGIASICPRMASRTFSRRKEPVVRLSNLQQAEQMQGGRMTMMPGPIDEVRALFQNTFASIKAFLPPPTNAIKTGKMFMSRFSSILPLADGTYHRGLDVAEWKEDPRISTCGQ